MSKVDDFDAFETAAREYSDDFARRRLYETTATPLPDPVMEIQLFLQHIPGREMLDAGCGWGRYVFRFLDEDLTYHGVDHSVEMLKSAREINPGVASFHVGSFLKLPFTDEQFDGIWSCNAFTTTPKFQLRSALKELERVLKPGGIIMVVMPLLGYCDEKHSTTEGHSGMKISTYLPMELASQLRVAGFTIIIENDDLKSKSMYVLAKKKPD